MTTDTGTIRHVRISRRSRRGVIMGLGPLRLATLSCAVPLLVLALVGGGPRTLLLAMPGAGALIAAVFLPVAGRPAVEWLPVTSMWLLRRTLRQNEFGIRPLRPRPAGTLALPGDAAALRVYDDPVSGAAMVHDPHAAWLSAVLRVEHPAFVMLAAGEQNARADGWGRVLAGLCQSGRIVRAQVLEQAFPDSGQGVKAWWRTHGVHDDSAAARSYAELVDTAGPTSERHTTLLTITLDEKRARRTIRAEGAGRRGAAAVLRQEMATLTEAVHAADLTPAGWLTADELATLIRGAFDPPASGSVDESSIGRVLPSAGPMGIVEEWDHLRADGSFHAALLVTEWPRSAVPVDFLHNLLVRLSGVQRSVSVIYQPRPAAVALREIRKDRVGYITDQAQREKLHQLTDFATSQEWADVEQRELDLVSGHGDLGFAGLIAVTAPTVDALQAALATTRQAALQSGCETRLLYGQQSQAFIAAALPFTRGLR